MRAIDTNLIVRLIAGDDEDQRIRSRRAIEAGNVLILPTVLLEAEWVLRSFYKLPRGRIADGLFKIIGLNGATIISHAALLSVIEAYAIRGDFADLLHAALATEAGATSLVTFDRSFSAPAGNGLAIETL